jgi:hypothetical protein
MEYIKIIFFVFLQLLNFIFGKECITSQNDSTSIICSENTYIITNLTYYLSNFSNITQLSLINSYLTEMPDLYSNNNQLIILHLDNNQIQLIDRNYLTIEYLYLTSNHIYALHLTNLSYPKLKYLDLSHNPIEHITENFFSYQQFPQLKILKLTNTLKHINPYLIDNRLISFSSLKYLNEIYLDENDFEEFICSKNTSHIQWNLPLNIKKISFGKNKLNSFDEFCFLQILNLTELNLHKNYLKNFSNLNFIFPYLSKIELDSNLFTNIPSNFLQSSKQLIELNLSANQLNLKGIKTKKQYHLFPDTLQILYLNSIKTDLSCSLFENLIELKELHLMNLTSTRLKNCIFKKLTKLKMVCEYEEFCLEYNKM